MFRSRFYNAERCRFSRLLGHLFKECYKGWNYSWIIAREFPQKDKTTIYLICENFSEEEERVLKGALEGIKYELVMEESIKDYEFVS